MFRGVRYNFTDNLVRDIRLTRRAELRDSIVRSLVLRVTPKGNRTWCVCFKAKVGEIGARGRRLAGVARRITLGPADSISVEQARERAREIVRVAHMGVNL